MFRRWLLALLLLPHASAQNSTLNATVDERIPIIPTYFGDEIQRLPEIAQEGAGLFLVSLAAWMLISILTMLVLAPLFKWLAARTPTDLDGKIIKIVTKPGIFLIFTFGFVDSAAIFELPRWALTAMEGLWQAIVVVTLTYIAYKIWTQVILEIGRKVSKKTANELDDKLYPLFSKIGGLVIIFVGIWMTVSSFGVNMTLFAAGGAVGGLVIAFAAQDTLANFFAGIHILVDQPFREGDRIEIKEENTWGDVVDIGLRTTRIRTRDNRLVIVPNAIIGSNLIINHTFPDTVYRLAADVGVAYGTDLDHAKKVVKEAIESVDGLMADHEVVVLFRKFGASSLDLQARYWIQTYADTREFEDKVNTAIYNGLNNAGIEIPFPQQVLWNGAKPDVPVVLGGES